MTLSDEDIGFTEEMYERLGLDELIDLDDINLALKEAFLRGRDYLHFKKLIDKSALRQKLIAKCESSGSLIVHNINDLLKYLELEDKK